MQPAELAAFAAALRDPAAPLPAGLVVPPGVRASERFAVHRNNVHASLIDALAERHPVTQALVGPEFFRAMARCFVLAQRPPDACLLHYGAGFPQFIATFAPARDLPYLHDVAALEGAWLETWSAPEAPVVELGVFAHGTPEAVAGAGLRAHPATRLLRSQWPAGSIWQCHQLPDPDLGGITWQPESVLLTRPHAHIRLTLLPPGSAAMATALLAGACIEEACGRALHAQPDLDPGTALRTLIETGFATEMLDP